MDLRAQHLERLRENNFDVLILGGGINGAGVARDLALRSARTGAGLRIALVEQRHFASGTSGKNSQLIHGGLRYLKGFEFGLVAEALRERATLLKIAPHLVKPLPFLLPMYGWCSRVYYSAGLLAYDLLAGSRNIRRHRSLSRREAERLEPGLARDGLTAAAIFYDARVHSARLVLENIFDAAANGAVVVNYARAAKLAADAVRVTDTLTGETFDVRARKLVDATGPWDRDARLRLVRGSHIVIPRVTSGNHAIAHFEPGGRIVFVIPWGERREVSLVGTTDVDHTSDPDDVHISKEEIRYLTGIVRRLFPGAGELPIVSTYSSLRPLVADGSLSPTAASREHRIANSPDGVLHISGGKYTTYRAMSEEAADLVTREIAPRLAGVHLTAVEPIRTMAVPEQARIEHAVLREMARHLSDLMFISTYWGYEQQWTEDSLLPYAREMGELLGWDEARVRQETAIIR